MKWMCGHVDNDNFIEFIIIVEFSGHMVVIIIIYQHSIHIGKVIFHMLIEMLDLV